MPTPQRRYPRVPFDKPGQLEVRVSPRRAPTRRMHVPVTIRSISCEGVGIALREPQALPIGRGASVTMHFSIGRYELQLPGRVAWHRDRGESTYPFDLGIRLQLELAPVEMRQAYATWIVGVIARARQQQLI
jgi:hypothetical protein